MPIILPHELATYLAGKDEWPAWAHGGQDETVEFWNHLRERGVDWAADPACQSTPPRPIGLYGDDIVYNKAGDKMVVVGWNDVLQKTVNMHNWPIFVLRVAACLGRCDLF